MFDRIVEVKVFNAKKIISDALIGSFKFELGLVYREEDHCFIHKWLLLTDPQYSAGGVKVHTYTHTYAHERTRTHTLQCTHTHMHTHIHVYSYTHMHMHACTHIHTHSYPYTVTAQTSSIMYVPLILACRDI